MKSPALRCALVLLSSPLLAAAADSNQPLAPFLQVTFDVETVQVSVRPNTSQELLDELPTRWLVQSWQSHTKRYGRPDLVERLARVNPLTGVGEYLTPPLAAGALHPLDLSGEHWAVARSVLRPKPSTGIVRSKFERGELLDPTVRPLSNRHEVLLHSSQGVALQLETGKAIRLTDYPLRRCTVLWDDLPLAARRIAFLEQGSGTSQGCARLSIWNGQGVLLYRESWRVASIYSLVFLRPDSKLLIWREGPWGSGKRVELIDAAQGIVTQLSPAAMQGRFVSDATGTKLLVVQHNLGEPSYSCAELWRCEATGGELTREATFDLPGYVFDVAFSPSGRRVAFLTRESSARLELVAVVYDVESRQELMRSEAQSPLTSGILFQDESILLCGVSSHAFQRGRHLVMSKMVYAYELGG